MAGSRRVYSVGLGFRVRNIYSRNGFNESAIDRVCGELLISHRKSAIRHTHPRIAQCRRALSPVKPRRDAAQG